MIEVLFLVVMTLFASLLHFFLKEQRDAREQMEEQRKVQAFMLFLLKKQERILEQQPESFNKSTLVINHCLEALSIQLSSKTIDYQHLPPFIVDEFWEQEGREEREQKFK